MTLLTPVLAALFCLFDICFIFGSLTAAPTYSLTIKNRKLVSPNPAYFPYLKHLRGSFCKMVPSQEKEYSTTLFARLIKIGHFSMINAETLKDINV